MPRLRRPEARAAGRRPQRGLTLIELLVSMLIMGFVLTLVSQAMYQVSQVTRSAQAVSAALTERWSGGWTASPMLANLVAPAEAPEGRAFEGEGDRLAGYTTLPLDGSERGVQAFALELVPEGEGPGTVMRAASVQPDGERSAPTPVARFPERAEFAYADAGGQLHARWPSGSVLAGRDTADLPQAVAVRSRADGRILMWYPFQGDTRKPVPPSTPFGALTP